MIQNLKIKCRKYIIEIQFMKTQSFLTCSTNPFHSGDSHTSTAPTWTSPISFGSYHTSLSFVFIKCCHQQHSRRLEFPHGKTRWRTWSDGKNNSINLNMKTMKMVYDMEWRVPLLHSHKHRNRTHVWLLKTMNECDEIL